MEFLREELIDPKDPLYTWKKRAWDRFLEIGLPTSRDEAFQYVHFKDFCFPRAAIEPKSSQEVQSLLFVDGFFQGARLPVPLVCMPTAQAMRVYGIFLQNHLSRSLKEERDPFAMLNGALQGKGAFLYIPPDTHIEEPILLDHLSTQPNLGSPRLHVFMGKRSTLKIIQRCIGSHSDSFCNGYIDVSLDAESSLFLGDLQGGHLQSIRCSQRKGSHFHFFSKTNGAAFSRTSLKVQLFEEDATALLQGLCKLDEANQHHTHILVEHIAPNCKSRQHFKGVLKGKSRSSFEGKIYVRPEAQKTESYQINNNLLLSDEATANAKPNLEIFADDVKASHGATISQLKEDELFYLRSRGLPLDVAKEVLVNGFCRDLLKDLPSFMKGYI